MQHPDYNSPSSLREFMQEQGLAMQKKFGQNFMINAEARKKIISHLDASKGDLVWEVGPGLGCMTELLLQTGASVTAFEIDRAFISLLPQFFDTYIKAKVFKIVEGDVLKTWKDEYKKIPDDKKVFLFGNLPYNIAATFIADTITENKIFDRCVFTVQKEVALRMAAKKGTPQYSAFSVLCQWGYDVKLLQTLPPASFWPRPNVASEAVLFTPRKDVLKCDNPDFFVKTVHALFASRRKTVSNNIKSLLPPGIDSEKIFSSCALSGNARAETLTPQNFVQLSQTVYSAIIKAKG